MDERLGSYECVSALVERLDVVCVVQECACVSVRVLAAHYARCPSAAEGRGGSTCARQECVCARVYACVVMILRACVRLRTCLLSLTSLGDESTAMPFLIGFTKRLLNWFLVPR